MVKRDDVHLADAACHPFLQQGHEQDPHDVATRSGWRRRPRRQSRRFPLEDRACHWPPGEPRLAQQRPSLGGGFEDVHLPRQIAVLYDMARTPQLVATIRIGDVGSTTNYVTMFDQNRRSRDKTLEMAMAFGRLLDWAREKPETGDYWLGKVVYYCIASAKWHLRQRHAFTAASRGAHAMAGLAALGRHLLSPAFWGGATQPHYRRVGLAIQDAGADHLYAASRQAMGLSAGDSTR